MKMLKKAAVILLAATMSLTMLTACGGGSNVGSAANESNTMEKRLIEVDGVEPTCTETEYTTTNGTWAYIETNVDSHKSARLDNIKTGDSYKINPTTMKAYKEAASSGETGDNANVTTTMGTWKDENGKVYITETITVAHSNTVKDVETWYCDGDRPAFIKFEYLGREKDHWELYKVTQYSRTANESKLNLNNYTIVENEEDLGLNY